MALHPVDFIPRVVAELLASQGRALTVGDYLPRGHHFYARVMNPLHDGAGKPLPWSTFAVGEREADATTKWAELLDDTKGVDATEGTIDPAVAATLARILGAHTSTPTECFFLIWEGYAGMRDVLRETAQITMFPDRQMLILAGDVADGGEAFDGVDGGRSAQWWIPADGAWAVANDLFGASVYVAGQEEVITAILAADDIESYQATASTQILAEKFRP